MNHAHVYPDAAPEVLARVDLNLLVAFDALVRERSVTKAAARVGVTQSAMSHALRRLRALFGDPLLVRGSAGMTATVRAEALATPIRSGLVTLGRALAAPDGFHLETARRTFTLVSPDVFDVVVVPKLLAELAVAPMVDLAVLPPGRDLLGRLASGELDVAVVPRMEDAEPSAASGFVRRTLLRDGYQCFVRRGHPVLRAKRVDLEAFVALRHLLVSPTGEGGGQVDEALARSGRTRRIALRVPHFTSALAIAARSDLVLTAPTTLARIAPPEIATFPAPLRLPRHGVDLLWHERFSADASHRWFRDRVVAATRPR